MYIALFDDFEVTDVIDFSIGSGAAAIGAQYKQCHYFGVCYNNIHMFWVRRLLQESFLNLVADGSISRIFSILFWNRANGDRHTIRRIFRI